MRWPLMKGMVFHVEAAHSAPPHPPSSSPLANVLSDGLFTNVVFHLAWINISVGRIVQCLDATEVVQVVPNPPG